MRKRIQLLAGIFFIGLFFLTSNIAQAQSKDKPAGVDGGRGIDLSQVFTLGAGTNASVASVYSTPSVLINLIVRNLFVVAGIILFITILVVGFKFVAQGTKGKDEAKTILTAAVTGFILMFVAYWIVQIIGILTGADIII